MPSQASSVSNMRLPATLRSLMLPARDRPIEGEAFRVQCRQAFHGTFDCYESLFGLLGNDAVYYRKAISLRHPLIFYFGHTATFFINKLLLAGLISARVDPQMESIFAVGVDEMSWDDLDGAHYDWPSVAAVQKYRDQVRAVVDELIETLPLDAPVGWESPWWVILMGIEHERIHLETSSVLIRQHRLENVKPQPGWQPCRKSGTAPENVLRTVPARQFKLGRDWKTAHYYGWDNEFGGHAADVAAFNASRYLVSNHEFLAFVEAGGYADDTLWSEEGAAWRRFAEAQQPTFWVRTDEGWRLRLMTEEVAMPWDWPVETNFHEAKAFCNWKARKTGRSIRLPTEDEWQSLCRHAGIGDDPQTVPAPANIELDHFASACPVTHFEQGGFFDVIGNVWQWLETPTYPFSGFEVHPIYDDFTTPTFDGQHNLIKGGSWISCGNEALPASRYAFRHHFFQHAGFRYVESDAPISGGADSRYETDQQVSEYCEFHWGDEYFDVPNFPRVLGELAIEAMGDRPAHRALDLGCATGRSTFELARHFEAVTGVDFSARFIDVGHRLAEHGRIRYTCADEGELVFYREQALAKFGLADVAGKVAFLQGDACNLKPDHTGYDLILAANLIDRLYDPALFLSGVHERIHPGGLLMIASPYTWLERHTPREKWIGGFKQDGESYATLDGLKAHLGKNFCMHGAPRQVPFVIRETSHKFQHSLAEVTVWERC